MSDVRTFLRMPRLGDRDERGSTLVLATLTITVVVITFTSLLTFESTTSRAQVALTNKRTSDLSADAAIDLAIAKVRTDPNTGVYDLASASTRSRTRTGRARTSRHFRTTKLR